LETSHEVSVRIEYANRWHTGRSNFLLSPRLSEQVLRRKGGDFAIVFFGENRSNFGRVHRHRGNRIPMSVVGNIACATNANKQYMSGGLRIAGIPCCLRQ